MLISFGSPVCLGGIGFYFEIGFAAFTFSLFLGVGHYLRYIGFLRLVGGRFRRLSERVNVNPYRIAERLIALDDFN
jgi:hypothetical protein